MGKEDRGSPVLIPSIWSSCEHSHCSASAAAWQVLRGRWWKLPPQRERPPPPGVKHTQHHSRPDHRTNCVHPARDIAWGGRNTQVCTWSTFALICLWYVCFLVFSFSRSFLFPIFLWQTTVNRLTEHIRDWHTQRALLNDKKLAPAAHHVFLSILVVTSPAPDVLPSILTDYTYDSELDNADGVPLKRPDAARGSRRGTPSLKWSLHLKDTGIMCQQCQGLTFRPVCSDQITDALHCFFTYFTPHSKKLKHKKALSCSADFLCAIIFNVIFSHLSTWCQHHWPLSH